MIMGSVHKLELVEVGDAFRFDPDEVLEKAKGQDFQALAVIGVQADGELWVSGNTNTGQTLIMLEYARHFLVFGSDEE